jgi:hypothetical protein
MVTYPNQRVVTIFKNKCDKDFLQINNAEWQIACQDIKTYSAFKLYLYFASNMHGYSLACSPAAIQEAIGICENTYRAAFKELLELGYLEQKQQKNFYWFNTKI